MDKDSLLKRIEEIKKSVPHNSYPSTTEMIKNVAQSIVKNTESVLGGNSLTITEREAQSRLNICKTCSFFDSVQERCTKCGCKMAVKTYLKAEKCPVGKW
jgi:hypothetical protein